MDRRHSKTLTASLVLGTLTLATTSAAQGSAGPIYIADPGNHRVVRVNDISGAGWTVLQQNPTGTDQLAGPDSIAFGPDGRMYITDRFRVVRVDDFGGHGWVSFGSQGSGANQFNGAAGITVDSRGHIYVADSGNHRIVSFDDMGGTNWVACCASASPALTYLEDVAVDDTTGQIFFTDLNNDRVVRVDTVDGGANLKAYGQFGTGTGQFRSPRGIFVRGGKVYVVDENNTRLVQMDTTLDGTGWTTVSTSPEGFVGPRYVYVDAAGHIFMTDYRQNQVVELDGIGIASFTLLGSAGSGVNQFSSPEGVVLGPAATGSARADLSLTLQVDVQSADAGQPVTYTLVGRNQGPDSAAAAMLIDLLPVGVTVQSANQNGTIGSDRVTWPLGDLPSGYPTASLVLKVDTPEVVDCKQPITDVAAISSTVTDPDPSNNYAIVTVKPLPAATENCSGTVDADCNGLVGCADPACASDPGCNSAPQSGATYVGLGSVPGGGVSSPPRGQAPPAPPPPPRRPTPDPDQPPPSDPSQEQPCARADTRAPLPSYCCDPLPPPQGSTSPSQTDWDTNCHAVDPNFLEATPATNSLGYGLTTDGGTIAYTIHYENIGGAAAHGVGIVTVLDPDLDAQTLVIGSGGTFDSASRTLSWLDPVLPPQVPRSVTFSANVRADAPPRTRVWAQATVIFPDAFPPSRTDTNALVHVVPYPDQPLQPALAVYRCVPVPASSNQWTAIIENRGFGFAYDVSAAIKSAPASVTVSQGTTSFSDIHDPTPDRLSSVTPLASTASRTPVSFTSPSSPDPCATMTWEISYSTSAGQRVVADVQAAADLNGNGIPDYLETDGGVDGGTRDGGVDGPVPTGCTCSATGPDVLVAPMLLALLVLVQLRGRRPS